MVVAGHAAGACTRDLSWWLPRARRCAPSVMARQLQRALFTAGVLAAVVSTQALGQAIVPPMAGPQPPESSRPAPKPPASADGSTESAALLYRGVPYGSQATFSPLTMLMNVGFEDFLAAGSDRRLGAFPFRRAAGATWDGVVHPIQAIERYGGWGPWIRSEILPIEFSLSAGWVPNYATHLVSGSLQTRMLSEWYRAHQVPLPRVMGSLTFLAASFLHESVQYPHATKGSATSVSDLYVFDLSASVLGHVGGMVPFLARRVDAANWAPLVSIVHPEGVVTNLGDYWIYKIPLPRTSRTRLFARVGYGTQFGVSRAMGDGLAVSMAFGEETDQRVIDAVTLDERVTIVHSVWASIDRNNSLLMSVGLSGRREDRVTVNVYPGVMRGRAAGFGLWLVADANGRTRAGVAHRSALGMGVGGTVRRAR